MEDEAVAGAPRLTRREASALRRDQIVRAAAQVFGAKGYRTGSLADVAEQVGITHAGVLHHFGTKEQLLVEVLQQRDEQGVADLEGRHMPRGIDLFHHLVRTVRANVQRRGIVQGYTVLTGESVTEDHPARAWVTGRFTTLRAEIAAAVRDVGGPQVSDEDARRAASAVIAVMDGLQVQWLLDPEAVDLAETTRVGIEAVLRAACPHVSLPRLG